MGEAARAVESNMDSNDGNEDEEIGHSKQGGQQSSADQHSSDTDMLSKLSWTLYNPFQLDPSDIFPTCSLCNGSQFKGHHHSKGSRYDVEITVRQIDYHQNILCGFLQISNLADEDPVLTTFFDGEIVSADYPFVTHKWGADEEIDFKHWDRFPSFEPYRETFANGCDYDELEKSDSIFMRWKERFLIPDQQVREIHGASLAGFYYICYDKVTDKIVGYYFHHQSEWCQSLTLSLMSDPPTTIYQMI